ncbi:MAG: crossover junction endodeoxyribonuclease RuvC [Thiotrichaceae bacterium]|nr:crossover junction endodeoxyribonuclease RuvC [Thiotrichaceae bacterium]PCI10490.1 MAG: crossover junction endodeoxyribonuclease RuvC [Thiotrichales bacterium]PCI12799.1 MAG: crossover junction endodeoxyribonuclease RuvC [Thiotrichales bacterium]
MIRILGIDPGSRITGFGVIDVSGNRLSYVASGCVRTAEGSLPERLKTIYEGIYEVVRSYQPLEMAIENVFMQKNAASALKLGQARGAAICAVVTQSVDVHEYSPTQIKKAVVGHGHADKTQVQHMVSALLNLPETPQADAADALACAICHSNTRQSLDYMTAAQIAREVAAR